MKAVLRFFWELVSQDPWRKLGAIGLALFLWLYVHQRITGEKEFVLQIQATSIDSWGPNPGVLYVKEPKGKLLQIYPSPNHQIVVTLRGTNRELAALSGPLRGYFDPADDRGELKVDRVGVPMDKIQWDHPQVAELLKGIRPERFNLDFESIESADLTPKPEMLEILGTPPEGFAVLREQAQFVPTTIRISGPKKAIEKLKRGEFAPLFKSLSVRKDDLSSPQSFLLDFAEDAQKAKLAIEDRGARAFIPIKPGIRAIRFRPRIFPVATGDDATKLLNLYRIQGANPSQLWVEVDWIADVPGTLATEVDQAWLEKNVRFFVDLGNIQKPEKEEISSIEVKQVWLLDSADRPRFEEIRFRPVDPARAKLIVEKNNGK